MKNLLLLLALVCTCFFQACNDYETKTLTTDEVKKLAIKNYANMAHAAYDDSYKTAVILKTQIDAFVESPTLQNFKACKKAWGNAKMQYGQTEVFRFYGGPIDDENDREVLINSWPINEQYIDYTVVEGEVVAGGIVNDTDITITKEQLIALNKVDDEGNISTGYQVIEFLLWGQDINNEKGGIRPYTDYLIDDEASASNGDRRKLYLKIVTEILCDHLKSVRDAWVEGAVYREAFEEADMDEAFGKIFTGMEKLCRDELADRKLFTPLNEQDQTKESAHFSDSTHIDIKMNFLSVNNAYLGKYARFGGQVVSGTGFSDIIARIDKQKNESVLVALDVTSVNIDAINKPFDQAIVKDKQDIEKAIEELRSLADRIDDARSVIGAANP